jgi:glycyl-tRNA synthetase
VHELDVEDKDRAHYSKKTIDFEYDFPFGRSELFGLAYRTDYDLTNHGVDYLDDVAGEKFVPHVIEPSYGVDRVMFALLNEAYTEDELNGEKRVYLKFKPNIAPVKVAVFPLLKNKPELVTKAREVFDMIRKEVPQTMFDDNGNIGKRYRRQDEIGTPNCITIDFDTLEDDTVTLRDRDTGEQKRIKVEEIISSIFI